MAPERPVLSVSRSNSLPVWVYGCYEQHTTVSLVQNGPVGMKVLIVHCPRHGTNGQSSGRSAEATAP